MLCKELCPSLFWALFHGFSVTSSPHFPPCLTQVPLHSLLSVLTVSAPWPWLSSVFAHVPYGLSGLSQCCLGSSGPHTSTLHLISGLYFCLPPTRLVCWCRSLTLTSAHLTLWYSPLSSPVSLEKNTAFHLSGLSNFPINIHTLSYL